MLDAANRAAHDRREIGGGPLMAVEYLDLEFLDVSDAADVSVRSRATPEDALWLITADGVPVVIHDETLRRRATWKPIDSSSGRWGPSPAKTRWDSATAFSTGCPTVLDR